MERSFRKNVRFKNFENYTDLLNMVCYADDIALIVDIEDDLQRLLYNFHLNCLKFNMKIS